MLKREVKEGGKPGIVTIRTTAVNQEGNIVLQYDRKIMVAPAGKQSEPTTIQNRPFPELKELSIALPEAKGSYPTDLTGINTYFENFNVGDIIVHANGRTITDEHFPWTYRVMNTHPLHYDRLYSTARTGAMSGEPIVYGGLVFAWLWGLASRDTTENGIADFGYTEGYHTQPAVSGDTIYAISRVLAKTDGPAGYHAGIVTFQLIGIKNIRPKEALQKYGADLFVKENDKKKLGKEKISEKIFEIERRVLIKRA